jgi:cytoskeletal protein CcmA (bactofilin family)
MAIDFPSPPVLNQIFVDPVSQITYKWDGSAWTGTSPGGILYAEQVWAEDLTGIHTLRKVGINTINPFYELDIRGTARVVGLITASNLHLNSNAVISGISTINGTLNANDIRIKSAGEKISRVTGNLVKIEYDRGSGNIGYCTSPTGDITLEIVGIPTDSSFDDHLLTFSVVVEQTGIARTCNTVKLNGVNADIKWPGGIVGVGNTNCVDIFNFTAINRVGSASSTENYLVLGFVNGEFK